MCESWDGRVVWEGCLDMCVCVCCECVMARVDVERNCHCEGSRRR